MFKVLFFVIALAMPVLGEENDTDVAFFERLYKQCGHGTNFNAMMIPLQKKFPTLTLDAKSSTFDQSFFTISDSLNSTFPDLLKFFSSAETGTCPKDYSDRSCTVELLQIYKNCYGGEEKAVSCFKKHVNDTYINKDDKEKSPENSTTCKSIDDLSKCLDPVFDECLKRQVDDKLWREAFGKFGTYLLCNVSCKATMEPTTIVASDSNVKSITKVTPMEPTTIVTPDSILTSSTKVLSNENGPERQKLKSKTHILVGLLCGLTLTVAIFCTLVYFRYFKKLRANQHEIRF